MAAEGASAHGGSRGRARRPALARELVVAAQAAASGHAVITSHDLARHSSGSAPRIRRDLARAGVAGKRGVGYDVGVLLRELSARLGPRPRRVAVIGSERLAERLIDSPLLRSTPVEIACVLDTDPRRVGATVAGHDVLHARRLPAAVARHGIEAGVIATPAGAAQHACDLLAAAGVRLVVSLARTLLEVPDGIAVVYPPDPAAELLFRISRATHAAEGPPAPVDL